MTRKLVAAITKIGKDHTELLGDTLAEIAAQKAGIITEGCTVVCYPDQPAEAMGPILTAAAEAHTSIITPDADDLVRVKGKRLQNRINYGGYDVVLGMPGAHQANHAAMAVEIALALWRDFGYDIPDEAILQGLAQARMPARIEVLRRHPLLLLDGCHNPDGVQALVDTLKAAEFEENLVGVVGMLQDKDTTPCCPSWRPASTSCTPSPPHAPAPCPPRNCKKKPAFTPMRKLSAAYLPPCARRLTTPRNTIWRVWWSAARCIWQRKHARGCLKRQKNNLPCLVATKYAPESLYRNGTDFFFHIFI